MASFAYRKGGKARSAFYCLLHTAAPPDAAAWRAYVASVDETLAVSSGCVHLFVATDGGGPDAAQRKELAAVLARDDRNGLTHVFTTSAFTRGIVTAFRWIARARAVAHRPEAFASVCGECGVSAAEVLACFDAMQASFAPVHILKDLHSSVTAPPRHAP